MVQTLARTLILLLMLPLGAAAANPPAGRLIEAVQNGDVAAMRALLRQHVDVNVPEPDGTTALHWAAHRGDVVAVDLLLGAGARVIAVNTFGITPLSLAVENGNRAVVDRLLKKGADPNTRVKGGETALMSAARAGRTDAVRALVEAGADVNAHETTRGQTALMWAAAEGHADIVRYLIQHGADIEAASHGPSSPPDITEGASLYKRSSPRVDIFTPLQFAVRAGRVEGARELLDAGANLEDRTPQGLDLLTLAIANAHYDMAVFLIERGADVNALHAGWSPLHQVVRMRTLSIGMWPYPEPTGNYTTLDLAKLLLAPGREHRQPHDETVCRRLERGNRPWFNALPLGHEGRRRGDDAAARGARSGRHRHQLERQHGDRPRGGHGDGEPQPGQRHGPGRGGGAEAGARAGRGRYRRCEQEGRHCPPRRRVSRDADSDSDPRGAWRDAEHQERARHHAD